MSHEIAASGKIIVEESTCPLCGSDEWKEHASYRDLDFNVPGIWRLVRCNHCKLIYLNPRPAPCSFYSVYPINYVPYQMELRPDMRWLMRKAIVTAYEGGKLREVERCGLQPASRILDVGCGGGFFLSLLKDNGWQAVGVEPNEELVRKATIRGLDVRLGTLANAELELGSFDAITLWHALEHDPEPRQTLAKCRKLLRPNGCVIVQLPDFGSWEARRFGNYFWGLDLPRHVNFFEQATLRRIGEEEGLYIEKIVRTRNPTSWVWSLLRWIGWDWYAEMERNIGKITAFYLLAAPFYYAISRGDWLTATMRRKQ